MLVISRRQSEKTTIVVGDKKIVIMIVEVDRGKVRLGIQADRDVAIYRDEILPPELAAMNGEGI
jgi:carbon storage regulator